VFNGRSDGQTIGWQVLAMYQDSTDDLWLGQQAFSGVTKLRNAERTVVPIPGTSANLDVRSILKDHEGNLWIGTSEDGLYRIKDGNSTHFGRQDGLGSDSIWCLHLDDQGTLWVGTCRGGLSRWQNGRFVTWTTKNGLINNVICQILEDANGNLWLGSYGGVFRISKKELNQSANEADPVVHCVGYNLEDGLPSIECQGGFQPSGYASPDGRLWFPTIKGLVVVDPKMTNPNSSPPTVVVEAVIADGLPNPVKHELGKSDLILPTTEAVIPPGNQRIEFQYTALSFSAPKGVRFKCRLEGLETEWEDAGTKRSAVYSHVPPGNYRFRVTACNSDGVWNETGASLAMVVRPYFWETKWFLTLIGLISLAVVVFIVRHSERRRMQRRLEKAERERAIEKERSRIAQDIHDELGANLTEIALLSEFAQEPSAPQKQVQADLQKITIKARNLTQMMDEVVWAVAPQNDTLEKFVTYTCSFAEEYMQTAKIICRLEVPEFLPEIILNSDVRHNLFLTIKEALTNIVKHAVASEVKIQITLESGSLIVLIQDNGKGFLNSSTLGSVENISTGGQRDGLYNMRKRIECIAGKMKLESLPGGGTCVRLTIILGNEATRKNG